MGDRHFIAGMWGRCGRAIPDAQVSELDNAIPMRQPVDMRQGRDSLTPVGRYSILAGKPLRSESDNNARATVFAAYLALVLMAVLAAILYCWPTH